MVVFSSLEKAKEHGFRWVEFRRDLEVHLVERVDTRFDGLLARSLAFARPLPEEGEASDEEAGDEESVPEGRPEAETPAEPVCP